MSFPCTKCGQCCINIKHIEPLAAYHSGDGVCVFYSFENGCEVYETRPDVCRIDEGYHLFFSKQLSQSDYIIKNADACNQLQESAGIGLEYRVILE